jgi:hypothetical protein
MTTGNPHDKTPGNIPLLESAARAGDQALLGQLLMDQRFPLEITNGVLFEAIERNDAATLATFAKQAPELFFYTHLLHAIHDERAESLAVILPLCKIKKNESEAFRKAVEKKQWGAAERLAPLSNVSAKDGASFILAIKNNAPLSLLSLFLEGKLSTERINEGLKWATELDQSATVDLMLALAKPSLDASQALASSVRGKKKALGLKLLPFSDPQRTLVALLIGPTEKPCLDQWLMASSRELRELWAQTRETDFPLSHHDVVCVQKALDRQAKASDFPENSERLARPRQRP